MALDLDEFKDDLAGIAREFGFTTFPSETQDKVRGWVKDVKANVIRAAAARAVNDEQDLAAASREVDLLLKAIAAEGAATAVKGVAAADAAAERLAGVALRILAKAAFAALV